MKKDNTVRFMVSPKELKFMKAEAKKRGITMSQYIRDKAIYEPQLNHKP